MTRDKQKINTCRKLAQRKGLTPRQACEFSKWYLSRYPWDGYRRPRVESVYYDWYYTRRNNVINETPINIANNANDPYDGLRIGDTFRSTNYGAQRLWRVIDQRSPRRDEAYVRSNNPHRGPRHQLRAIQDRPDYQHCSIIEEAY